MMTAIAAIESAKARDGSPHDTDQPEALAQPAGQLRYRKKTRRR